MGPDKPKLSSITKSMLVSFRRCPLAMKLQFIDGHPLLETGALLEGRRFHELSNAFFNLVSLDKMEEIDTFQELYRYFRTLHPYSCFTKFEAQRFWRYFRNRPDEWLPKFLEIEISDNEFVGHIDRFDVFRGNGIIYEYKAKYSQGVKFELAYYYSLFNKVKPSGYEATHVACFAYHEPSFKIWQPTTRMLSLVEKAKRNIRLAIEENDFPPNLRSCEWCDFIHICEEKK